MTFLLKMEDHRMKGNMHQARSSKEIQYEGKSYWSSSLFYISAQPQYKDETSRQPGLAFKHPDRGNKVG